MDPPLINLFDQVGEFGAQVLDQLFRLAQSGQLGLERGVLVFELLEAAGHVGELALLVLHLLLEDGELLAPFALLFVEPFNQVADLGQVHRFQIHAQNSFSPAKSR